MKMQPSRRTSPYNVGPTIRILLGRTLLNVAMEFGKICCPEWSANAVVFRMCLQAFGKAFGQLANQAGFKEGEEVFASHGKELTNEELMRPMQEDVKKTVAEVAIWHR